MIFGDEKPPLRLRTDALGFALPNREASSLSCLLKDLLPEAFIMIVNLYSIRWLVLLMSVHQIQDHQKECTSVPLTIRCLFLGVMAKRIPW